MKRYLIVTFSVAWVLQVIASKFVWAGNQQMFTMVLAASMFAPLLGALSTGWHIQNVILPYLKENWKTYLKALFAPTILTILGAALYFVIFPSRFTMNGEYILAAYGQDTVNAITNSGQTLQSYIFTLCIQASILAPLINMIAAFGEECGWRGYMYPVLKQKFGVRKGRILGGLIWGMWHWPIMILAGYEYGLVYPGAPLTGMILFPIVTSGLGILFDVLYEEGKSIWIPSLAHGALNATASLPLLFLKPQFAGLMILGPISIGAISCIPLLLCAAKISDKTFD